MTESHWRKKHFLPVLILSSVAVVAATGSLPCQAADSITVESRKADGTLNTPTWSEVSGKWNTSKNKSRVPSSFIATNISICTTNVPVPAFKISPAGLVTNTTYKVEVTFSTSSTHVAAPDLVVGVTADGVSTSTIPETVSAFQGSNADTWNALGTITPETDSPSLTFTYLSGTLTKESRWYADAVRFTPVATTK